VYGRVLFQGIWYESEPRLQGESSICYNYSYATTTPMLCLRVDWLEIEMLLPGN